MTQQVQFVQVSTSELMQLINDGVKNQLIDFASRLNLKSGNDEKPNLSRKETAELFGVSLNCLNDWTRKGFLTAYKVGQRTYYKRSECLQVMFNQKTA
jgi:hypothetical protein